MSSEGRGHKQLADQPELYGVADTQVHDAWTELLKRYPAHCFATLTFRRERYFTDKSGNVQAINRTGHNGSVHPEMAGKAFRLLVSRINRRIYGAGWHRKPHAGCQWAYGQEFHKDGRLHLHALLSAPTDDLNQLISRYEFHEWWYREFGRNQIEQPRSQAEVASYVSKYVTKGGVIEFSRNFGAWIPPRPAYAITPQQTALPVAAPATPLAPRQMQSTTGSTP